MPLENADITNVTVKSTIPAVVPGDPFYEQLKATTTMMKSLMELQDEFYRRHPIRRVLKELGFIPDPDIKARLWALDHYDGELPANLKAEAARFRASVL